jgi:Holliday junction resolvasome RuvABC ATP-dependent DNA helicase subunit
LQTTDAQNGSAPQTNATALQNALFKSAIWKLGSELEQNKTQHPSHCSSTSDASQTASDDTVSTSDSKDGSSDASSVASSNSADDPVEKSKDDVSETRNSAEGGCQATTPKPSLLITSEEEKGEDGTETPARDSPPAVAPGTGDAKPVEVATEKAPKVAKPSAEPGLDFSRVSESASHPGAKDEASTSGVAKKLSKDAKAERAAALKKRREEKKKEHEEQVEDLIEEIAHQREVLRLRRDQKTQKQKLQALQKRLERLCQKELDDDDEYVTSDDEDADDYASPEKESPPAKTDDKDAEGDDGDPAKDEPDSSAAKEDKTSEAEDTNAWPTVSSKAKQEWEERKKSRDEENVHLDGIMDFIGLESVKSKMLEIKTLVDTSRRQDVNLTRERFNTALVGNSGTGKTTLAKLYAKFLSSLDLADDMVVTSSGSKLVYEGINELKNVISMVDERGVILIDDVHVIRPDISSTGRKVLDYLVTEMDRLQGNVIFIFTGSGKDMETFLTHNRSLQSRVPFTISFEDYQDAELLQILEKQLHDKFNGKLKVEKGVNGVYMRIVARRIGRCRGPSNFGNAREVENTLMRILFRQAVRLEEARKADKDVDDLFLAMEDIVGPPPSTALENSKAWKSLQGMVGLKSVKESLKAIVHQLQISYDRELAEKPVVDCPLNRIFLGNPGTGKTTVAKYYGQIMVDIGLLTDGEVVVKSPADFIGEYLGESENITKRILASTRGKVLIIDEAYGLNDSSDEANEHGCGNIYKTAIIDTLVANIQGAPNECILLLGYRDRMERMFQASNPGLARRFPMSSAFEFDDFTDEELREILDLKLKEQTYTAPDDAKNVAMEVLARARNHRHFGNAGEVDVLLSRAKELQQARLAACTEEYDPFLLESQDFDADFERPSHAEVRIRDLFKDFVGADDLVEKLVGYSRMVQNAKALEMSVSFFSFSGSPSSMFWNVSEHIT